MGIGSGKFVDGQVLVLYDILGIGNKLSFTKDFLSESNSIEECVKNYIQAVKKVRFLKTKFLCVLRIIKEAATNIRYPLRIHEIAVETLEEYSLKSLLLIFQTSIG